jgi:hypothetical protein
LPFNLSASVQHELVNTGMAMRKSAIHLPFPSHLLRLGSVAAGGVIAAAVGSGAVPAGGVVPAAGGVPVGMMLSPCVWFLCVSMILGVVLRPDPFT